jgi:ribosome-associated translation inhibitor RaiA
LRPLTPDLWREHHAELRDHVLTRWPQVPREDLFPLGDDFDGVVALLQRSTGLDADAARTQLQGLSVPELNIGYGEEPDEVEDDGSAGLDRLSLGKGFTEIDRRLVTDRLRQLERHLRRFRSDATFLEISVKDRDTTSQSLTLEIEVPGFNRVVATSQEADLRAALSDVRHDSIAQIEKMVGKRSEGAR